MKTKTDIIKQIISLLKPKSEKVEDNPYGLNGEYSYWFLLRDGRLVCLMVYDAPDEEVINEIWHGDEYG